MHVSTGVRSDMKIVRDSNTRLVIFQTGLWHEIASDHSINDRSMHWNIRYNFEKKLNFKNKTNGQN